MDARAIRAHFSFCFNFTRSNGNPYINQQFITANQQEISFSRVTHACKKNLERQEDLPKV